MTNRIDFFGRDEPSGLEEIKLNLECLVDEDVVKHALTIYKHLLNKLPFLIFPTLRGSVQLEYEVGLNYIEFEIYEDQITVYMEINEHEQYDDIISEQDIDKYVDEFIELTKG